MSEEVIKTIGLSIGYDGKELMPSIDVTLHQGELVAITGPNGSGKTTLFKTLTGTLRPVGGQTILLGRDLQEYHPVERAKLISIVLTEKPDDLFLSVFDIVAAGRAPYLGWLSKLQQQDRDIIEEKMQRVGILHLQHRDFVSLSDGEKQKVMIAKALAQDTPIIFLDEPTAFLDYPSKVELMQLLQRLAKEEHKTILFSSHDLDLLMKLSEQIWVMAPKKSLQAGTPQELLERHVIEEYFGCDETTLNLLSK